MNPKQVIKASRSQAQGKEAQRQAIVLAKEIGAFDGRAHLAESPMGQLLAANPHIALMRVRS